MMQNAWRIEFEKGSHIPGRGYVRAETATLYVPGTAREALKAAVRETREPGHHKVVAKIYRNNKIVAECRRTISNRQMTRNVRGRAAARCHILDARFKQSVTRKKKR